MHTAWLWLRPLLVAGVVGAVLSMAWYRVRAVFFPGVETAKLPTWAKVCQVIVEIILNLPGALRAGSGAPSTPPGSAPSTSAAPPPAGDAVTPTTGGPVP